MPMYGTSILRLFLSSSSYQTVMRAPDTSARDLPLKSKSPRLRLPVPVGGGPSSRTEGRTDSTGRRRLLGATSSSRSMSRLGAYLATSPLIVSKSSSTSPCRSGMAGVLPVFASRLLAPLAGGGTSPRSWRILRVTALCSDLSTFEWRFCRSMHSSIRRFCTMPLSRAKTSSAARRSDSNCASTMLRRYLRIWSALACNPVFC
mmetsp:Transcript_24770/g.59127  ORF Transcript_24770/g.59127 Transcript_24770/m.59127 type:complete len:203 (-) Transcript_24770:179-787(-)